MTEEELQQYFKDVFSNLDPHKREKCIIWMRKLLDQQEVISSKGSLVKLGQCITEEKKNDFFHFGFGMVIRNWMRDAGFGEKYFGVDCLDDYYGSFISEALKRVPTSEEPQDDFVSRRKIDLRDI